MAKQQSREQGITLRGSADIVAEFFCEEPPGPGGKSGRQCPRGRGGGSIGTLRCPPPAPCWISRGEGQSQAAPAQ